jgi:CRP-like cAMP-binding protein
MTRQVYPAHGPRYQETFPTLTAEETERLRRFGTLRKYADGEKLLETGMAAPGAFVVLSGVVAITERGGLGHATPIVEQGPGQFLGEVGQLSGRASLVDGVAEGDVEALLIPPERLRSLLVAEADLGERIMRSLIVRRVALLQGGAGGVVLIGPPAAADVVRLKVFLARNGYPQHLLDPATDPEAKEVIARYADIAGGLPLAVCPDGTVLGDPPESALARQIGMTIPPRSNYVYDVAVVGAGPSGLSTAVYAESEGLSVAVLDARLRRPSGRQRPHRKLSRFSDRNIRSGSGRSRLHPGAKVRRGHPDSRLGEDARLLERQRRLCPGDGRRRPHSGPRGGDRERRAVSSSRDRRYPALRKPRRLVLGVANRSSPMCRRGSGSRRRRQFGGAGRRLSFRARVRGSNDGARASPKACRAI